MRRGKKDRCITYRIDNDLKSKEYYQLGESASGSPATRASRMPILMPSWFSDPRAPRSSVGAICHNEIKLKLHTKISVISANDGVIWMPTLLLVPLRCRAAQQQTKCQSQALPGCVQVPCFQSRLNRNCPNHVLPYVNTYHIKWSLLLFRYSC